MSFFQIIHAYIMSLKYFTFDFIKKKIEFIMITSLYFKGLNVLGRE